MWWGGASDEEGVALEEGVAPLLQALGAGSGLPGVGSRGVLQPIREELRVLPQQQELTQNHRRLIESLVLQLLPQNLSDPGQRRDRFVSHRFRHKVPVLLRRGRHPGLGEFCRTGEKPETF